jgi:hypothetical protein
VKRAKLTQAPVTRPARSADLTDRLLDREGQPSSLPPKRGEELHPSLRAEAQAGARTAKPPEPKPSSRKRAAPKGRGKGIGAAPHGSESAQKPASTAERNLGTYVPYRTVEPGPPVTPGPQLGPLDALGIPNGVPATLKRALSLAEEAVAALAAAAAEAPARLDLAVRYRLDALAHHLRQVAEFMGGHAGSR